MAKEEIKKTKRKKAVSSPSKKLVKKKSSSKAKKETVNNVEENIKKTENSTPNSMDKNKEKNIKENSIEEKVEEVVVDNENNNEKIFGLASPFDDSKYIEYFRAINSLRCDGENKVIALKDEIRDIKLNKQIDKESKQNLINENLKELEVAEKIRSENKDKVLRHIKDIKDEGNKEFKLYFKQIKESYKKEIKDAKELYTTMLEKFKLNHSKKVSEIKASKETNPEYKIDLKTENIAYSALINEAKTAKTESIDKAKANKYNAFMNKYNYMSKITNDKHNLFEILAYKKEHYVANFNFVNWLIKNALYIIIIIIFAALVALSGVNAVNSGEPSQFLLYGENILEALVQIAPKIFFALGAAGLILLGGTDLSIGRLTGIGVSFTLMILSTTVYSDNFGGIWFNLTGAPGAVKVVVALLISITFCTFFSAFAGFFTAKFKMHPFISTLAVQLISFGFFQLFWSGVASFTASTEPGSVVDILRGPNSVLLIVYAIVAIAIIWFIWNKTKFGKNMYAVGGNQEAAAVSGINPVAITLFAFIMAGILYGFGGFVQALQVPAGNFNSGYGTETDAIAACVIGGISFSGGVGKVGGAVIGAVILGFLTYAFSSLGINANLQLLIKGIIILVAVALDCVKYLRKK